jgi:hypothetical protein
MLQCHFCLGLCWKCLRSIEVIVGRLITSKGLRQVLLFSDQMIATHCVEKAISRARSDTMQVDHGITLARMEDCPRASKDWTVTRVSNMPQTACPRAYLGFPQACTNAHMRHMYSSFLSKPCRRLPGATSGTNKRNGGRIRASHHHPVRCEPMLSLGVNRVVSGPVEAVEGNIGGRRPHNRMRMWLLA